MLLSRAGYYSDFVVYPVLLVPLGAALALGDGTLRLELAWAAACLSGVAGFSLLEYAVHRVLLHCVPPFRRMHALHHAHPTARVGSPTWATATVGSGVFLAAWWMGGLTIACGLTFGLVASYLWYSVTHHAVHHWAARPGSYLHMAKRRHARHHHAREACNFGVTTACWDHIFGTAHAR